MFLPVRKEIFLMMYFYFYCWAALVLNHYTADRWYKYKIIHRSRKHSLAHTHTHIHRVLIRMNFYYIKCNRILSISLCCCKTLSRFSKSFRVKTITIPRPLITFSARGIFLLFQYRCIIEHFNIFVDSWNSLKQRLQKLTIPLKVSSKKYLFILDLIVMETCF